MTIPYEATDKTCIECGAPVEDYTGHSGASEVTLCEECPDEVEKDKWQYRADIVHRIPRKKTMTFTIRVPYEIEELDDESLLSEQEALVAHEEADVLTEEQETYLNDLRNELYKRMAFGGPYADYTGPEESDEE